MPNPPLEPIRLAVLVSGSGTTLQNLLDAIGRGALRARVALVVGSRPDLAGVKRATDAGVPAVVVNRTDYADVAAFSREVFARLDRAEVDLVCLGGWLCLLDIPPHYRHKLINIHPSLLPSFGGKGMYGQRVHQAVIDHGCKVSGCTVHFVDATYDTGPIIVQRTCEVRDDDDARALAARVFEEEKVAYPQAVRLFAEGRLRVEGRRVRVS